MGIEIPQYTAQQGLEPEQFDMRHLRLDDSVGQALSQVGGAITQVGDRAAALQDQTDRMHAEIGLQALNEGLATASATVQQNLPPDGSGLEQTLKSSAIDPSISAFKASITNPKLKDEFSLRADLLGQRHLDAANQTEYDLRNKFSVTTAGQFADQDGQTIAANPTQFSQVQSDYTSKVNALPMLTEAQKADLITKFNQNSAALLGRSLHASDPETLYYMTPHPEVPAEKFNADRQAYIGNGLVKAMIATESAGDPNAVSNKGAAGLMQVMPGTAMDIAKAIGDKAFIAATPAVRADMLADPKINVTYGSYYINKLLKDNNGDLQLALIAYNAGQSRADQFKEAGGDWSKMGAWANETQPYVQKIIGAMGTKAMAALPSMYDAQASAATPGAAPQSGIDLPIVTGNKYQGLLLGTQAGRQPLNMNGVRPEVLNGWKQVQNTLGFQVPIVSGFRDPLTNMTAGGAKSSQHLDGNAIDLDVSKLPVDKRLALIQTASAAGFTGIGVYRNSIHLDMRDSGPVAWGPSHHSDSIPDWAQSTMAAHVSGGYKAGVMPGSHNVLVQPASGMGDLPPAVLPADAVNPPAGGTGQVGDLPSASSGTPASPAGTVAANAPVAGSRPYVSSAFKDLSPVTLQEFASQSAATLATQAAKDGGALDTLKAQVASQSASDVDSIMQSGKPLVADADMPAFTQQMLMTHGAAAVIKYQQERAAAVQVHELTKDLPNMSQDQMNALLDTIKPKGGPDAEVQQQIFDEVSKRVKETVTSNHALQTAANESAKAASDQAANGYLQRMLKADPTDADKLKNDIINDPNLSWETRKTLGNMMVARNGGMATDVKKYGDGYWDTYQKILAPPGDPARVEEASQILKQAGPGGNLTMAGAEKLLTVMNQARRSVNDASVASAKAGMMAYAKQNLSFDQETVSPYMPPLKDPKGQAIFNSQFIPKFEAGFDQWVKDGKDPWAYLTKDNVDKMITGMRPSSQMAADRIAAGAEGAAQSFKSDAQPEAAIPAPQGLDAGGWSQVIQSVPYKPDGTTLAPDKWAGVVSKLMTFRSSPDVIAQFDERFAKSGLDAKTIINTLDPPKKLVIPTPEGTPRGGRGGK